MSVLQLIVNESTRKLSNRSSNQVFVVNDANVDAIRFSIPAGFSDIDIDENAAFRVMYIPPGIDKTVYAKTLTFVQNDGVYISYDWQVGPNVLVESGILTVSFCILKTGSKLQEWHTIPYQITVLNTIHTNDSDEADESITPTVAERVAVLETMMQRVTSGAPVVVGSVSDMTDTAQIYVLSTDGNWYYHNGSAWVAGGVYGAGATDTTLTQSGIPADAKAVGDAINEVKADLDDSNERLTESVGDVKNAISIISDEQYSVGNSIYRTLQAANYRITANGTIVDNTRILKVYPLGSKPIYIKSQDGIQYRSGTSGSTAIKTILGAFDGRVYPLSGANYVAISFETSATIYGAWEAVSDLETTYKTAINNANAIADNGEYFSEISGTSSSTYLFEDIATALSAGDFLVVNFYSMEGATWSTLQVYGFDAENVSRTLLNASSVGSYLLPISASYVKIRVRVNDFANPTNPKLVYGIYKSTDLTTLSGAMAHLRGKVSVLESASNDLNNAIGNYFRKVTGGNSATALVEDVFVDVSEGDYVLLNLYSIEGATWNSVEFFGFDANSVFTRIAEFTELGSYIVPIHDTYVRLRVRVSITNPTRPVLVYGMYPSNDLLTISGLISNTKKEIADLDSKIDAIDSKGYMAGTPITPTASVNGYRITTDGTVSDSTRVLKAYPISDVPLYVKTQDGYQYRSGMGGSTALKTVIGEYSGIVQPYVGANYITISFETDATAYGVFKNLYKLDNLSPLTGSKINYFGDSFTDDYTSYARVMADRVDLTPVYAAKGGSAIVTDYHSGTLDAPSFLSRLDGTAPRPSGGYYMGLSTAADITIIFGGINDCRDLGSGAITMGNIDSTHDASTFYGGMQLLLDRIIARCTDQFMLGVIPPSFMPNAPYTTYISQVQEAEREIYRKYHIPYVDLAYDCYAMSDNVDVMTIYRKSVVSPTNYHPNALGAKKICDLIQGKLEAMYRYDA